MAESGESRCRIIHGKGAGVLQKVVEHDLADLIAEGIIDKVKKWLRIKKEI